ncbi:uncharacterized protein [Miscanthus floridulus]|uniref:uncharacterized protein n=1 Tax=Miscanthus floridulus TaxID=154761 RepID=UPI00345792BF
MADGIVIAEHGRSIWGSGSSTHVVESYEEEEWECAGLEPFFFDVAEAVADHERRMQIEQENEQEKARLEDLLKQRRQAYDRSRDYDPKQGGRYMTRCFFYDFLQFDVDEESSLGPVRYTDKVYKMDDFCPLLNAVNILSVKIASLDVKFPIHVYGTVIARDSFDRKCVYVFRRTRDNCQVIKSKTQSLTLEGPKRGLVLLDDLFIEIDLKIKDVRQKSAQRGRDRELSKGFVRIKGTGRILEKSLVESKYLATRLSTVEVGCSVVKDGLESLVAIEVLRGEFSGKITACTVHVPHSLLLHDSKLGGKKVGGVKGVIQLLQPVITVGRGDKLIVVIQTSDGVSKRTVEFTRRIRSSDEDVITVGATKMRVKVSWSVMDW